MTMYLISELAKKANTTVDAVRFYQKKSLIRASMQADNHYYYYDQQSLQRLMFIKKCRDLDISLVEITQLLSLLDDPEHCCHTVNQLISQHILSLEQQISRLQQFHSQLTEIYASCQQLGQIDSCAIMQHFKHVQQRQW